jgi:hypothetical protein
VLSNGNFVVDSPDWDDNTGAVTWGNGTTGVSGVVSAANSLVGKNAGDQLGSNGVTVLANGNYVVDSPQFDLEFGAVTCCNGNEPTAGLPTSDNSLFGSHIGDQVGSFGVIPLSAVYYIVVSPDWNSDCGAVTVVNSDSGQTSNLQNVSADNSLLGSTSGDLVGSSGVTLLNDGDFVVVSPHWNSDSGAISWGLVQYAIGLLSQFVIEYLLW